MAGRPQPASEAGPPPSGPPPGGPPGGHQQPTDDLRFLRGVQLTDRAGTAAFKTIYPGWYTGRAIHIHLKVHIGGAVQRGRYTGGQVAHTGQLYFPEPINDRIALLDPYRTNTVTRIRNEQDMFYANGGAAGLLTVQPVRRDRAGDGALATILVGVDPDAVPAPA